jgi:hypothetical protein
MVEHANRLEDQRIPKILFGYNPAAKRSRKLKKMEKLMFNLIRS